MFEDMEWFVSPWQLDFALQAWSFTRMRVTDGPLLAWASGWFSCKGPWKENSLVCTQIDVATLTFSSICCDFSRYFDEGPLFPCFFLSAWRPAVYHLGRLGAVGFPFCPGRRKASRGEAITRTQPARWAGAAGQSHGMRQPLWRRFVQHCLGVYHVWILAPWHTGKRRADHLRVRKREMQYRDAQNLDGSIPIVIVVGTKAAEKTLLGEFMGSFQYWAIMVPCVCCSLRLECLDTPASVSPSWKTFRMFDCPFDIGTG